VGDLVYGWTHSYDIVLETGFGTASEGLIRIQAETGRVRYFLKNAAGVYEGYFNERTHVTVESEDYVWYRLDGSRYGFSAEGKLTWIDDEKGNELSLTYDVQGNIETVTDAASARVLDFHYVNGLLDHVTGPATGAVSYGYDGSQIITVSQGRDIYGNVMNTDTATVMTAARTCLLSPMQTVRDLATATTITT